MKRLHQNQLTLGCLALLLCPWPGQAAATVELGPGQVVLRNEHYRYVFDTGQGLKLRELFNRYTADNDVKDPTALYLGLIDAAGDRVTLNTMRVAKTRIASEGQVEFTLENSAWHCLLTIAGNDTPETRWTLAIRHAGANPARVKVVFPLLSGLVPGPSLEDTWFHHGLNGLMIGRQPVHLRGASGYSFPVMDIFNKRLGGLYMITEDPDQHLKGYELIKKEAGKTPRLYSESHWEPTRAEGVFAHNWGCGMAVVQGLHLLNSNETYETPPVVIGVHPGRWEKAWESYRDWLRSQTRFRSDNTVDWWRQVYVSKAIHQQHFWKDNQFDWAGTIRPFDRNTYFDINHWMNNRGDYRFRLDHGGAVAWKTQLAWLRRQNIHSALYLEACCVNPLSEVGRAHPDWAVLNGATRSQEKGEGNPPRPESREYNMCAGSPWRDYLAATTARVLRESEADAIYLDSMALRFYFCDDEQHDHPAGQGWHRNVGEALRRVTQAIDQVKPNTPLYCEFYSSDLNAQYLHGSYCPMVAVARNLTGQGFDFCRTGTCLFRFYFPKFKMIEICDLNEANLGLALFNGNGVHEFFDKPERWPYLEECARIWEQNAEAFASNEPEALLETGQADLFMNRFPDGRKTIYTLWNCSSQPLKQTPLALKPKPGCHYVELFSHRAFETRGDHVLVDVPAAGLAVMAEVPAILRLEKTATGDVVAACQGAFAEPRLLACVKVGAQWLEKTVPFEVPPVPTNDNDQSVAGPDRAAPAHYTVTWTKRIKLRGYSS
ncbi:MAG: DUF6259 domain-containing protein [Verrucomicrobiia bacterium]